MDQDSRVFEALAEQRDAGQATPPRLISPMSSPSKSQAGCPSPSRVAGNGHRSQLDL